MTSLVQQRFPALQHRDFVRLWAAGSASSIALWTLILGNAWITFQLTDSSRWVGAVAFASFFPFLLSPIGGVAADRFDRTRVLQVTRIGAVIATAGALLLAVSGALEAWMVLGLALGGGAVRAAESPAEQALLPNTVPSSAVANAVVLNLASRLGSRAVGPLLGGPLLATIGVEGAYGIALAFTVLSVALLTRVQTRSRGGVARFGDAAQGLVEGLRYARSNAGVLSLFALVVAHCSLTMSFDALLPSFADHHLHSATNGLTVLSVSVGVGAFVATLALAAGADRRRGPVFLVTGVVSGVGPILLALSGTLPAGAASAAVMGASQAMFMALAAVFLQEAVEDAVRGRIMSLYTMSAGGIMAFANLGLGTMADATGTLVLLVIPGVAFVALLLASLPVAPQLRHLYGSGGLARSAAPAGGAS